MLPEVNLRLACRSEKIPSGPNAGAILASTAGSFYLVFQGKKCRMY